MKLVPKITLFKKTLLAMSFAGISSIASAKSINIDELVVFGDSVSDNGTLAQLTKGQAPETFTNGRIWSDYLAEELGAAQLNFAVAGAQVVGHDSPQLEGFAAAGAFKPFGIVGLGLRGQVSSYLATNPDDQSGTLHTVFIGGNDILAFIEQRSEFENLKEVANHVVGEITGSVNRLVAGGAKNILVFQLPDIGKSPLFDLPEFEGQGKTASRLAQLVNINLAGKLFTHQRRAGVHYNLLTTNGTQVFNGLTASGEFDNTEDTWLVLDENRNPTGNVNGNPDDFLFWDNVHPTTRVHQDIAEAVSAKLNRNAHCIGNDDCTIARDLSMQ